MNIREMHHHDLPAICHIYNQAILNTTAVWLDEVVDLDNRRHWAQSRKNAGYPVLIADIDGEVAGFASFGDFKDFIGYRYIVEHSVYIDERFRRQGVASALLQALEARARELGKHVMVGGISANNESSIAFHLAQGYVEVARMPEVGRKFGEWQTLVFVQKQLDGLI